MLPTRIAELLRPFLGDNELSAGTLQDISKYIDILVHWNSRINLTAIRDPEDIVPRHFGESLFAARHLFPRDGQAGTATVADIGSGAGFPGIPLKLWAPQISLTLVEANHKKATFLREVARSLTLTNIDIQNARAETLAGRSFDLITLRAVESFETILPIAAALVAPVGRLALLIGKSQIAPAHAVLNQASTQAPPWHWSPPIPVPLARSRVLLTVARSY